MNEVTDQDVTAFLDWLAAAKGDRLHFATNNRKGDTVAQLYIVDERLDAVSLAHYAGSWPGGGRFTAQQRADIGVRAFQFVSTQPYQEYPPSPRG